MPKLINTANIIAQITPVVKNTIVYDELKFNHSQKNLNLKSDLSKSLYLFFIAPNAKLKITNVVIYDVVRKTVTFRMHTIDVPMLTTEQIKALDGCKVTPEQYKIIRHNMDVVRVSPQHKLSDKGNEHIIYFEDRSHITIYI